MLSFVEQNPIDAVIIWVEIIYCDVYKLLAIKMPAPYMQKALRKRYLGKLHAIVEGLGSNADNSIGDGIFSFLSSWVPN